MLKPLRCPVRETKPCPSGRQPHEAAHRYEVMGVAGRTQCPEHRVNLEVIPDDQSG